MREKNVKERPIIFSSEMVRAILEGRKTQTRREIKNIKLREELPPNLSDLTVSPYGKVGDRLWVRETFFEEYDRDTMEPIGECHYAATCDYEVMKMDADGWRATRKDGSDASPWKSPMFMPRWASRITLEITNIRVERLDDISEKDALAEGIYKVGSIYEASPKISMAPDAKTAFAYLWESLKGKDSWQKNPWVWVIEFKRV
jgi:hypothetical protein